MSHITPFCPSCGAYFPAGATCPACRQADHCSKPRPRRISRFGACSSPARRRCALRWRTSTAARSCCSPGATAKRGRAAWSRWTRRMAAGPGTTPLDMPVEGGVAVAEAAGVAVVGLARRGHFSSEGAITALDLRTGQRVLAEQGAGRRRGGGRARHGWRPRVRGGQRRPALLRGRALRPPGLEEAGRGQARPHPGLARLARRARDRADHRRGHLRRDAVAGRRQARRVRCGPAGGYGPPQAGGQVRGAPVIVKGRVYRGGLPRQPGLGVLSAFELRTGRPVWPEPFTIPAPPGGRSDIVAAPLGDRRHGLCRQPRPLAARGRCRDRQGPLVARGPRAASCRRRPGSKGWWSSAPTTAWSTRWMRSRASGRGSYELGGHVQAGLAGRWGDVIFAASDNGDGRRAPVARGAVCLGRRTAGGGPAVERSGRLPGVGCAFQWQTGRPRGEATAGRPHDWYAAEAHERAAEMWTALGAHEARWRKEAADAWREAGLVRCGREPARAATYLETRRPISTHKLRLASCLTNVRRRWLSAPGLPFLACTS